MDIGFTAYLWLNVIIFGFLFGVGWIIAGAVYAAILSVLGRGKAPQQP